MANNNYRATVTPDLPAHLFSAQELRSLEIACGLTYERDDENLYFFAETCFSELGEDDHGFRVNCLALLQEKLRQLDADTYPHITIHGAATCSKMRPDEFGGFAIRITRAAIRSISTWEWLAEQDVRSRIAATTSAIAEADAVGIAPEPLAPTLRAALTWLLDDFTDAGQDRDPVTGVEYDSVAYARAALAAGQTANPQCTAPIARFDSFEIEPPVNKRPFD
jgi:hypothetical protein